MGNRTDNLAVRNKTQNNTTQTAEICP